MIKRKYLIITSLAIAVALMLVSSAQASIGLPDYDSGWVSINPGQTYSNHVVEITKRLMGDVDGDGDVDAMDLLTLKLALSPGTPYYGTTPGADVDLNGKINVIDLLTLKLILSGIL